MLGPRAFRGCLSAAASLGHTHRPLTPPALGATFSSGAQSVSRGCSSLGWLWPTPVGPCMGASPPGLRARASATVAWRLRA